jgi:hypothetical protein
VSGPRAKELPGQLLTTEYAAEQVPACDVVEPGDAPVDTGVGAEAGDEAGALPSVVAHSDAPESNSLFCTM